jgi:hypothetical protein
VHDFGINGNRARKTNFLFSGHNLKLRHMEYRRKPD